MQFIEPWLYWTQVFCIVLSLVLALFMLWRYFAKRYTHIFAWAIAWIFVAIRVYVGLHPPSPLRNFVNDFLTIVADLLWFLGLALLLEMPTMRKVCFPVAYLSIFSIVVAIIYFGLTNRVLGAFVTTVIAHPILLFMLSWYFHICTKATGYLGARIISIALFMWAWDYIILGVPYFGMGIILAGVIGWSIGLIFRIMMFVGFSMIAVER